MCTYVGILPLTAIAMDAVHWTLLQPCSNAWLKQQLIRTHGMNIKFVFEPIIINVHTCAACVFHLILYELGVCMLSLSLS